MRLVEQNGGLGKIQVSDEQHRALLDLINSNDSYVELKTRHLMNSLFPGFRLEKGLSLLFHESYSFGSKETGIQSKEFTLH